MKELLKAIGVVAAIFAVAAIIGVTVILTGSKGHARRPGPVAVSYTTAPVNPSGTVYGGPAWPRGCVWILDSLGNDECWHGPVPPGFVVVPQPASCVALLWTGDDRSRVQCEGPNE